MKRFVVILFLFFFATGAFAQENTVNADEVLKTVAETIRENEALLDALGIDVGQAQTFVTNLNSSFQGTYVYDLASLRETANQLIPILQQFEETRAYAAWLRARLDYFEVAEKLREQAVARPSKTNISFVAPTPQVQRRAWISIVEERPIPPQAKKHVPVLKQIFAEEKVPTELVWLAEVESSFNRKAKSPAGATGLFQIMPATAKNLNLSTGIFGIGDERTDAEKSGRAAARYLRKLYTRFGDWRLALAAYNAGEGRVSDLLKKYKAHSFDEIASRLPAETQMYVPKVEAVVLKREGMTLAQLKSPKG